MELMLPQIRVWKGPLLIPSHTLCYTHTEIRIGTTIRTLKTKAAFHF